MLISKWIRNASNRIEVVKFNNKLEDRVANLHLFNNSKPYKITNTKMQDTNSRFKLNNINK